VCSKGRKTHNHPFQSVLLIRRMLLLATTIAYTLAYSTGNVLPIRSSWKSMHTIPSLPPRDDTQDMCPRQILEIVWYCIATLIASSWLAVHPSLLSPGQPKFLRFLQRTLAMIRTIIIPEFVIHLAMEEWYTTR